jgi:putative component of toxin-antitoxin plasmid stabilization module
MQLDKIKGSLARNKIFSRLKRLQISLQLNI